MNQSINQLNLSFDFFFHQITQTIPTSSRTPQPDRELNGNINIVLVSDLPIDSQLIGSSFAYNRPLNGFNVFNATVIESWPQNN